METKSNKRPQIHIEKTSMDKFIIIVGVLGVILTWIYLGIMWNSLPDIIPTHFGIDGEPNDFGNKLSLIFLPVIHSVIYILIYILAKFPHKFNYIVEITKENAEKQYRNASRLMYVLSTEISILFLYINWGSIQTSLNKVSGLGGIFIFLLDLIIFGTLGFFIYRMIKYK